MEPLHADRALAETIERSAARDLERYAEACHALDPGLALATERIAGGFALYVAPGSPLNVLLGAGLHGRVSPAEIDLLERFYMDRGTSAAVSLSPFADESLITLLGGRGWILTDFENVLVRQLAGLEGSPEAVESTAEGAAVRVAGDPDERARWASISATASVIPDEASPEVARLSAASASRDDMTLLIGTVGGKDAGVAALWPDGGLCWMTEDATLPEYRRQGVQTALLAERMKIAARAGCRLAVADARPGSESQRNMERLGFTVAYTRVEMIACPRR